MRNPASPYTSVATIRLPEDDSTNLYAAVGVNLERTIFSKTKKIFPLEQPHIGAIAARV
jgi:hypothetical protein